MAHKAKLSSRHTVSDWLRMESTEDRRGIAELIRVRLEERYIAPAENSRAKHGFASMALACLLIETLQSFREGLSDTKGNSIKMFARFLGSDPRFADLAEFGKSFYFDVRCGILHQGETRGGWIICRRGPLFEAPEKRLNATLFLRTLSRSLGDYCDELERASWHDDIWIKCRAKFSAIVEYCKTTP